MYRACYSCATVLNKTTVMYAELPRKSERRALQLTYIPLYAGISGQLFCSLSASFRSPYWEAGSCSSSPRIRNV